MTNDDRNDNNVYAAKAALLWSNYYEDVTKVDEDCCYRETKK